MGKLAGQKDAKILSGTKAGDLPIEDAPDYAIVFNLPHTFGGAVRVYDNFVRNHKTLRPTPAMAALSLNGWVTGRRRASRSRS